MGPFTQIEMANGPCMILGRRVGWTKDGLINAVS